MKNILFTLTLLSFSFFQSLFAQKLYPPVNDLTFKWNEQTQKYDITNKFSKKIEVTKDGDGWFISVGGINDASTSISIHKLGESLYIVEVSYNELGC